MTVLLETGRLVLRQFTADDADLLVQLDSDPEVVWFLTKGVPTPREKIENDVPPRLLADYDRHQDYGCASIEKVTGEFIGWLCLRPPDGKPDEPELGYRLRKAAWRNGYATEGSRALIDKAFSDLGATRVYAETMAVNDRSRRVMEKLGMTHVRTSHLEFDDPIPGTELGEVEYELRRADWVGHRP